ncbi:phage holin, LLH family [Weissella cibaria]|uniref:phage holin, LLH family n=1 Tax=Weissella cibaria TaxID=137591 RepID=UPI0036D9B283
MTTNNLITFAEALWQSGIAPALLILAIGWASERVTRNKRLANLLGIAEGAVKWAEATFDGGQTQKAQAIKWITDHLMKADKAHLFTAKQIDEAIEWAVKKMKEAEK